MTQNQPIPKLCVAPQLHLVPLAPSVPPLNYKILHASTSRLFANKTSASESVEHCERVQSNKEKHFYTSLEGDYLVPESELTQTCHQRPDLEVSSSTTTALTDIIMGNRQSENKDSDNEMLEEQTASCCKTPKRKQKDKSGKQLSTRVADDPEFDSGEVYPFGKKFKEDSEIVEPVDLEPFEIIETDDLSFISGAGTSGVILSGTNGQYRISREIILEEKETDETLPTEHEKTKENILSQTTNDLHTKSQARSAHKSEKDLGSYKDAKSTSDTETRKETQKSVQIEQQQELPMLGANAANDSNSRMFLLFQNMFSKAKDTTETSVGKSDLKDNTKTKSIDTELPTSNSENLIDRKMKTKITHETNSDLLQSPSKTIQETKHKSVNSAVYENLNATGVDKIIAKQAPIQTVVPVKYILTQEMFKSGNISETETDRQESVVCAPLASMEDIDLSETNADLNNDSKAVNEENTRVHTQGKDLVRTRDIVNITNPTYGNKNDDDSIISGTPEENIYETVDRNASRYSDKENEQSLYESISVGHIEKLKDHSDQSTSVHIVPSITQDMADSQTHCTASVENHSETSLNVEPNEKIGTFDKVIVSTGTTETTQLYNMVTESAVDENKYQHNHLDSLKSAILSKTDSLEVPSRDETAASSREDTVPPPSPASMNILTEENEDEEDEPDSTKNNEMAEFGDVVCKRLSKLLEDNSFQDEDTATTNVDQDSIIYFSPREFVGTSTGKYEIQDLDTYDETQDTYSKKKDNIQSENDVQKHHNVSTSLTSESNQLQNTEIKRLSIKRNDSSETLKRASGDSAKYNASQSDGSSSDDLPEFFDPENLHGRSNEETVSSKDNSKLALPLKDFDDTFVETTPNSSFVDDLTDVTPTAGVSGEFTALPELAKTDEKSVVQYEQTDQATGRRSITGTESDLDISEQRTNVSTDSMYADDEAEETMDILFTKTYTEPIEGAEVFLSCTVVNSAFKDEAKKREVWLSSDETLEYFEANASEVMSTAFMKAKQEMKDIQLCLQNLRKQMDNFHGNFDDISLPDLPKAVANSLSPDCIDAHRKAVTD